MEQRPKEAIRWVLVIPSLGWEDGGGRLGEINCCMKINRLKVHGTVLMCSQFLFTINKILQR